jgi:hypothetical protein
MQNGIEANEAGNERQYHGREIKGAYQYTPVSMSAAGTKRTSLHTVWPVLPRSEGLSEGNLVCNQAVAESLQ